MFIPSIIERETRVLVLPKAQSRAGGVLRIPSVTKAQGQRSIIVI
ncbi:Unknown protein sequence [Pseudomonas amygdali pv. mellea]|nr:Unknown protein sequence [Pseudomonas amygdali pv. mellea]